MGCGGSKNEKKEAKNEKNDNKNENNSNNNKIVETNKNTNNNNKIEEKKDGGSLITGVTEGDIFDKYTFKEELGRGAFSIVKLAVSKNNGDKVAVKVIDKSKMSDQYKKNLQMETEILKKVDHPSIIKMLEIFETDDYLFLVMELVTGGELFDKIVEKGCYTEKEAAILVHKIVSAIDYLHDMDICHRDLKPENLLLRNPEADTDVKIADFGLSKIVSTQVMMQTACGTPGYVAPEVLNATGYAKEVDMWSIGVITYILLCGFPPFFGDTVPQLFEQIMKAEYDYPSDYWDDVSNTAKDFIDHLLVVDPKDRMTTKQALNHKWLSEVQSDSVLKVGGKMNDFVSKHKEDTKGKKTADKLNF